MAAYLIRGISPGRILAQYMGRVDGLTRGRDGNMHMGDLNAQHGVAIISALAATVPVAAGAALALKYLGTNGVAFCYFGDGSTSRGDWHEGVNMATVLKLPVVYICNNNQYAYSTPLSGQMACANVADRGPAYGMPAEIVDGNDVLAVHEATGRAVAHARAGPGPLPARVQDLPHDRPLRARCRRVRAGGPVRGVGQARPHRAPGKKMIADGWADRAGIDALRARCYRKWTMPSPGPTSSPYPDPATLLDGVYDGRIAMPTTYLEAIREGLWEEMERDPNVFLLGEDIGVYGGAFKVTAGFYRALRRAARGGYADFRSRHCGRGHRRGADGPAAGGRNAVRRFHFLRLRPDRQLRRQVPLSLERAPCPSWCARPPAAASTAARSTRRIPRCGS